MNSAEGFAVNNVAQHERTHPQAGPGEVPAMVGWMLPLFQGPEKVSDEGAFKQPFSVGSGGDRPGLHERATRSASLATSGHLGNFRFRDLFHRLLLADAFVRLEESGQRLELRHAVTPPQQRPRDPLLLEKMAQPARKASPKLFPV